MREDGGAPPHASSSARRARRRLLIAEDEAVLARALEDALSATHDVIVAKHGADALSTIDERGPAIDFVLSDVHMPWMNGVDLHRALVTRASPLAARFLLMSGSPLSSAHAAYVEAAGVRVLPKPFRIEQLERALAAIATAPAERRKSG